MAINLIFEFGSLLSFLLFFLFKILKYMYYMLSTAMEDEETQNRGISLIVLNITTSSQSNGMPWGNLFGSTAAGGLLDPFWAIWREIRKLYSISRLHYCMISSDHSTTPYSSRISEEYAKTQIRIHQGMKLMSQ